MRRALTLALVVVAAVAVAVVVRQHRDATAKRVDVIFDTAKGMVGGQLVKIAGARAGRVDAVHLTPDHRARMQLRIEDRFVPFHADATCRILPEGPISENYVECDPGVQTSRPLPAVRGVPTVGLAHTTSPVSIQDLLDVFAAPTQMRLRLLINELGIGTAGRGNDINDILRRTNPTLRDAQALLGVINGQRAQLGRAIDQTDQVLAGVGASSADVHRFVAGSAATAQALARHPAALSTAVNRLPGLLRSARSGLRAIDRATTAGTPLLASLQQSGPQLTTLTKTLPAFARAAVPAVRATTAASIEGRRTVKSARRLGRSLKSLAATTPVLTNLRDFMVSSRDKGAFEQLLRVPYSLANLTSLYNGVSHVVTLFAGVPLQCLIPGITAPGCDQTYYGPRVPLNDPRNLGVTQTLLSNALAKLTGGRKSAAKHVAKRPAKTATPKLPSITKVVPNLSKPLQSVAGSVQELLGGIGSLLHPRSRSDGGISDLLDYLLR